jgi:hypothetical protein
LKIGIKNHICDSRFRVCKAKTGQIIAVPQNDGWGGLTLTQAPIIMNSYERTLLKLSSKFI